MADTETNFTRLEKKYRRSNLPPWENMEKVLTVLLVILLPLLVGLLTRWVGNTLFHNTLVDGVYTLRPGEFAWVWPGYLFGFGAIGYAMNFFYRRYLRWKYNPSFLSTPPFSQRSIAGNRWSAWFFWTGVSLAILVTFFLRDNELRFDRKTIRINELTNLKERQYALQDLKAVRVVKERSERKERVTNTYHALVFRDGYTFRSRDNALSYTNELEILAGLRGLRIDTIIQLK